MADLGDVGTLITASFAGLGGLLVALNSWRGRGREMDEADQEELSRHRRWRPMVRRWHANESARMADLGAPELADLPAFPPRAKDEKPVKTDDDS